MIQLSTVSLAGAALVGIINLLPVLGVLGGERLAGAYGISVGSPELEILLRHRALLFGLVGGFVLVSLGLPAYRLPALILAGISMAGFLVIALGVGGYGTALARVVRADVIGLVCLAVALIDPIINRTHFVPG